MTALPSSAACGVLLLAGALSAPAAAQTADPPRAAAYLAANCANCHGTQGQPQGEMPPLAGKTKEFIVEQLRLFRDGKRPATIMHQLSKGYTEAQIDAIGEHFARLAAR